MESVRCFFVFVAHHECHRGSLFPLNGIEEVDFQRLPGSLTAGSPENQPLENINSDLGNHNWVVISNIFYFQPYLGKMNPF